MARLFPIRSETPSGGEQPRIVDLEDEDADAVFSALSSATARDIYSTLADEPGTPSDIAEAIDSSIQNVRYHLEKLENAGLVEVVDTWYSSRGNEMSVYATADGPLIVTSDESTASKLKTALSRYLGGIVGLAGASLLVQYGLSEYFTPTGGEDLAGADDGDAERGEEPAGMETDDEQSTVESEEADEETAGDDIGISEHDEPVTDRDEADDSTDEPVVDDSPDSEPAADTIVESFGDPETTEAILSVVSPGALFFMGGVVVLTVVVGYWYWRSY